MSLIEMVRRLREKHGTLDGAEDWDELERAVNGTGELNASKWVKGLKK